MFFLLLILLQYNLSESRKQNYLLYLSKSGEENQAGGEMTPVVHSSQGSDYSLGQSIISRSTDCNVKKDTTILRKGYKYRMTCRINSTEPFDTCQFRKIELRVLLWTSFDYDKLIWVTTLVVINTIQFNIWPVRTPTGDTFEVTEDMSEDNGRIVCLCKVVAEHGNMKSQINQNCAGTRKKNWHGQIVWNQNKGTSV